MDDFHFLRPLWLFALLPLAVLAWALLKNKYQQNNWKTVCDVDLLPYILDRTPGRQQRWPIAAVLTSGIIAIFALAGPTWKRIPTPVFQNQAALVIILDLSRSMDATDVKPSRLIRARYKIADILKSRKEGQNALIVFAGEPFVVTPLTDDSATILNQLSVLDTSLMPSPGSNVAAALVKAKDLFQQAGLSRGDIILITDEVNPEPDFKIAKQMNSENFTVSVLAIGTSEGAPIAVPSGGFLKDNGGNIVIPRLNLQSLKKMASIGGGIYRTLSNDSSDIEALLTTLNPRTSTENIESSGGQIEQWHDEGFWLILLLLPLGILAFRKGYLIIPICILVSSPNPAQAFEWQNLWATPDQRAARAYKNGQLEHAAKQFENLDWKGAAEYSTGQYQQAAKTLENVATSDGFYNKGNALAKSGQYEGAMEAYEKALEIDPDNEDAQYNKDLVEEQLEKQQKPQSSSSKSPENSEKSEQQNGEQSQQDQDSSEQQSSSQNQQPSEEPGKEDSSAEDTVDPNPSEGDPPPPEQNARKAEKDSKKLDPVEDEQEPAMTQSQSEHSELKEDAVEQWLKRIPDDPGGLLRRKFKYQYQRRKSRSTSDPKTW